MKIAILGSGVIGVTTAYYSARAGHEVTVIDRQSGSAMETSFANAGEISPGYAAPWAAPDLPLKLFKWMVMRHSPLVVRLRADAAMWRWTMQLLCNCTAARYAINKGRMLPLAGYSRDLLRALRNEIGISYDERSLGTLQLFRSRHQLDGAARDVAVLERCGVPYQLLDVQQCIDAEPALARVAGKIAGGLRLPDDETGDCFKFTRALEQKARELGVQFRYGVTVRSLVAGTDRVVHVDTDHGPLHADAWVVALGSYSPLLLQKIGIRIPVYPVKGYSITVPVAEPDAAPQSTVMDETHKTAITRLGERIRVAGTAELGGYDLRLRKSREQTLVHVLRDLYPHGGDLSRVEPWCGLRPMTPDGPPVIGRTRYRNLFLNTGHGTLGWTMSCGSGRITADIVSGIAPEIDVESLQLARYG
jgi:D-amino-acid dehydrogenase